ncbi:Foie gras liver health family 1-domain-containing protein [Cunninghamella echinulata]|nr:Foie gras liver health family 1-domain-containing protein [Cunninghamella echinulata]
MDSYPTEYSLHPVPVLAIYGLKHNNNHIDNSTTQIESTSTPLSSTLLSILLARQDFSLYDSSRYLTNANIPPPFRVINVSKDYVVPEPTPVNTHSTLSPLSPESPLYSDGIMSPLWIKKHLNLPSVIVGCYDLWDWSQEPGSPIRPRRETGPLSSHILIDPTEREKDTLLAHEINDKRKYYQEKGIKFAAIILLKERQKDDPSVEERCNIIRKASGLDSKTSFFSLSPGSIQEVQEFVNILYRCLFDPAIQYYNNLIKKVRKKRSKVVSQHQQRPAHLESSESQPLSIIGWNIRYDFKTALLQEFKQDIEGAIRTLGNTYTMLVDYLSPPNTTSNLLIRGKRWMEARTLADCITIKIYRFYLYLNDPSSALAQLNGHLHMFQSYSSAWAMGEQSFEYWAWLSKQYRIFADVVDLAIQHGFKVPNPSSSITPGSPNLPNSPLLGGGHNYKINDNNIGCNPGAILQHPGFYYHLSAMCCAERRRRYLEMNKMDNSKDTTTTTSDQQHQISLRNLLATESQVDHSGFTIELLTKSYEQFKRYHNGRMTLYLAAEIAGTYYESGKFEMALKFFERIGKTYRKERWYTILTSILRWSLRCAKELGSWERAIECLIELMSDALPMSDNKRGEIYQELLLILDKQKPSSSSTADNKIPHPFHIYMTQINSFIQCHVQFREKTNYVNTPLAFQVTLQANKHSPPTNTFRFSALRILFSDEQYNHYLVDAGSDDGLSEQSPTLIDCSHDLEKIQDGSDFDGWFTKKVNLGLSKNQTKVIEGSIIPKVCEEIKIVGVYLDIISPNWVVSLQYSFDQPKNDVQISRRKWLQKPLDLSQQPKFKLLDGRGELDLVRIMQRPPCVDLSMQHSAPGLLNELFPTIVTLSSKESETIDVTLQIDMKNVEGHDKIYIMVDGKPEILSGNIKLGQVDPGQSINKTIYLYASLLTGSRLVTLTVTYTSAGNNKNSIMEKSEAIRIPFVSPFDTSFELCSNNQSVKPIKNAYIPNTSQTDTWLLVASIQCCSAWDLLIDRLVFENQNYENPNVSLKWQTGHVYNANYLFKMTILDLTSTIPSVPTGNLTIFWKRFDEDCPISKTTIPLPSISIPQPIITIKADVPSEIYLGEPITLVYVIDNPTTSIAEYSGSIELSEAFVFSGYKQVKGQILPMTQKIYSYICYPLLAGKVKLPKLKIIAKYQSSEKEVPVNMIGNGAIHMLGNDLQPKQSLMNDNDSTSTIPLQQLLVFVNARRK